MQHTACLTVTLAFPLTSGAALTDPPVALFSTLFPVVSGSAAGPVADGRADTVAHEALATGASQAQPCPLHVCKYIFNIYIDIYRERENVSYASKCVNTYLTHTRTHKMCQILVYAR